MAKRNSRFSFPLPGADQSGVSLGFPTPQSAAPLAPFSLMNAPFARRPDFNPFPGGGVVALEAELRARRRRMFIGAGLGTGAGRAGTILSSGRQPTLLGTGQIFQPQTLLGM